MDFQWSSAPHLSETLSPADPDYAHINSIAIQPNGDVLASFRHLSSVFLIASKPHDGHLPGDVIWKLGGRDSDFTFPPGDGGPCAQHSASVLPNGNVLLFDNGSFHFGNLCIDPSAPQSPPIQRNSTRVVEFALDTAAHTAEVVRTYGPLDRYSWFMGSVARLANGNTLIGWSADTRAISTESDLTGATIWTLADTGRNQDGSLGAAYFSYRATLVPARDGFDPEIELEAPADGAVLTQGASAPIHFACTDRGGSTLQTCEGPAGRHLDTSTVGTHTWSVAARDGAGRASHVTRSYTVVTGPTGPTASPPPATTPPTPAPPATTPSGSAGGPDLALRVLPRGRWVGANESTPRRQRARTTMPAPGDVRTARLRVTNTDINATRVRLRAPRTLGRGAIDISYTSGGVTYTDTSDGRGWRTPVLAPGASWQVNVRVTARRRPARFATKLKIRASARGWQDRVDLVLRRH